MGRTLPLDYSLGLSLDADGKVLSAMWDGPAFTAGIVPGAQIVAVNAVTYSGDAMRRAITTAMSSRGDRRNSPGRSD